MAVGPTRRKQDKLAVLAAGFALAAWFVTPAFGGQTISQFAVTGAEQLLAFVSQSQ